MDGEDSNIVAHCRQLIDEGRAAQAVGPLASWLSERPNDVDAWAVKGAALFEIGELEAAKRAAQRVIELRPYEARNWCNLGTILRKLGEPEAAERAQRQALILDRGYRRARTELRKIRNASAAPTDSEDTSEEDTTSRRKPPRKQKGGRQIGISWGAVLASVVGGLLLALLLLFIVEDISTARRQEEERQRQAAADQAERQRQRQMMLQEAQRQAQLREQQRQYEIDSQMRRNTVEYVDSFQSTWRGAGNRTDAQRKASWDAEFGGQWVRWEGTVREVSGRGETCSVTLRCGPHTITSDTRFELDRATAVMLRKNQKIRIEGQLADHGSSGYTLENVRVVAKW